MVIKRISIFARSGLIQQIALAEAAEQKARPNDRVEEHADINSKMAVHEVVGRGI